MLNILKQFGERLVLLRYQVTLLSLLILVVYYPAITAEISIVDDLDMVSGILNSEQFSLKDILIPRSAGGGYYRPVTILTYYLDYCLWQMSSSFMHLENILLHIANMLMVFYIAKIVSEQYLPQRIISLPFFAAIVFGLHPIATESVNWISGRTDLLAGLFVLISTYFLLCYKFYRSYSSLFGFVFALGIAVFAKEVAFGFILAIPLILALPEKAVSESPVSDSHVSSPTVQILIFSSLTIVLIMAGMSFWTMPAIGLLFLLISQRNSLKELKSSQLLVRTFTIFLVLASTIILFFVMRKIAFTSDIDRISNTLRLMYQDTGYAISLFTGAAGFYVKKFFLPLPLNFFILEIDPLYDLFGIVVFFCGLYMLFQRNIVAVFSITGVSLFLPALPFAFGTIAWTGYAERYIYISSAFWSVAVLFVIMSIRQTGRVEKIIPVVLLMLVMIMSVVTFNRNLVWQTNMSLIADTVSKSPRQKELRGLYMLAFIRAGDLKSAREQYRIASFLHSNKYLESYDLNMAGIEAAEGNKKAAEKLLQKVIDETNGKSVVALKTYSKFLENELNFATESSSVVLLQDKLIPLYNHLYELNHDPFILYRLGQIYITRDDSKTAVEMFEKVVKEYPDGIMYKDNSVKIIKKLQKKISDKATGCLP